MAEGKLRGEDRNLTSAKNLKFATARKPALNLSILVVHSCLNQGEWVSSLVGSQQSWTPWWVVGGGAQGRRKIYTMYGVHLQKEQTKPVRIRSDGEAADFPKFIVIESLQEVCWSNSCLSLFKKLFQQVLHRKMWGKSQTETWLSRCTVGIKK